VLAFLSLAACGQTGPLYLPGNPSQVEVPTDGGREASLPVPEDDAEDTDDNDEQGY
jgi:predicted small lipoprotein YifL